MQKKEKKKKEKEEKRIAYAKAKSVREGDNPGNLGKKKGRKKKKKGIDEVPQGVHEKRKSRPRPFSLSPSLLPLRGEEEKETLGKKGRGELYPPCRCPDEPGC